MLKREHLTKPIFSDGTTIGQVAFHTAESANYYLTVFILNTPYPRKRDLEFSQTHSLEKIFASIDRALEICTRLPARNIRLDGKLQKTKMVKSIGYEVQYVFEVIQHVSAHTANHVGQINMSVSCIGCQEKKWMFSHPVNESKYSVPYRSASHNYFLQMQLSCVILFECIV